jgi:TolB protein
VALLTLAALAASAAAAAAPAQAAYPGANGRIAFQRLDGYIYSVNPDGTGLRKLGRGWGPAYSPSGTRIAFAFNGDIWTMNADGTNRQRVTSAPADDREPTWSPDGTKLAFASSRNTGGIYVLRSTAPYGSAVRLVATPNPPDESIIASDAEPAWATNGFIYFTRDAHYGAGGSGCDDTHDTMRVDPAAKTVIRIEPWAVSADIGPAAGALVYDNDLIDTMCVGYDGIALAQITGAHPHAVTPLRSSLPIDSEPVFSPDGTRIAFERGGSIYVIRPNGLGLQKVVLGGAPSWQPIP